jgi:hypothetical protein
MMAGSALLRVVALLALFYVPAAAARRPFAGSVLYSRCATLSALFSLHSLIAEAGPTRA